MEPANTIEPNVKLTAYVPNEMKERVEKFGEKTFRNLSSSIQYLLETHPELKEKTETAQLELNK